MRHRIVEVSWTLNGKFYSQRHNTNSSLEDVVKKFKQSRDPKHWPIENVKAKEV